jgi:hypothetical protein
MYIIGVNIAKPPPCTLTREGLSNNTRACQGAPWLRDLHWTIKQNKQGVCHTVALPFAFKSILWQKKN